MKHTDIRRNLSAYLDDSVAPEERTIIEEHLESCRECRGFLEELKNTAEYVRDLEEVEPPTWLAGKIMARVRDEAARKESIIKRLFSPLHVKLSIEAAALVLVTVTGYLVFRVSQPEMGLDGTAMKEESRRAAPSTAAPSAPPAAASAEKRGKDERPGVKEDRNVLPLKPPERKTEPRPGGKELPPVAPETGPAPAPGTGAVPRGLEPLDMIRKKDSSSALQAEKSMGARGMFEEGRSGAEEDRLAKRKAMPLQENTEAIVSFVLRSADSASLADDIENLVARLGGRVVKREWSDRRRAVSALIDGRKLNLLREKLGSFGAVAVRGNIAGDMHGTGDVSVLIEVEGE